MARPVDTPLARISTDLEASYLRGIHPNPTLLTDGFQFIQTHNVPLPNAKERLAAPLEVGFEVVALEQEKE